MHSLFLFSGRDAMRKILAMLMLMPPVLLMGQAKTLTIDDLLGAATGAPGRAPAEVRTADSKYLVVLEHGQIALRPVDDGESKALTSSTAPKFEIEPSPDGKRVAYISEGQVWVVGLDGRAPIELTHDATGAGVPRGATDHHPQSNPNGKWILYESGTKG